MLLGRSRTCALLATTVVTTLAASTQVASAAVVYGPSGEYTQVLRGQFEFVPLPDAAMIDETPRGYVYRAGQQDSDLEVTEVVGGLRFHDRGTLKFKSLPESCRREAVDVGVAAVCTVPDRFDENGEHMLVEVWPRLGDDRVDASSLSASFDVTVLADAGFDVVKTGAGNDFVNGAFQDDHVMSGAGNDWVRTGTGNDTLDGGGGHDKLVGSDDQDDLRGGAGDDVVYGGAGDDELWAGAGRDVASCSTGADVAYVDASDRVRDCESVFFP